MTFFFAWMTMKIGREILLDVDPEFALGQVDDMPNGSLHLKISS